jgi:hypothetical protein
MHAAVRPYITHNLLPQVISVMSVPHCCSSCWCWPCTLPLLLIMPVPACVHAACLALRMPLTCPHALLHPEVAVPLQDWEVQHVLAPAGQPNNQVDGRLDRI